MDTLTHALSGALLGRATAPKDAPPGTTWKRVAAGFLACAAPDLDFVIGYAGPLAYLANHRGVTHSLILLPFWALLYSWILSKLLRYPGGWRGLYGITAMALGLHILGDYITSFGTIVLAPLSDWRAALGTTFIIDLWFTGIILAGLLLSLLWRRSRIPAVAASVLLAGYVGFQYVQRQKALEFGQQYAQAQGMKDARVVAHPRPVSAFNWTVFVSDESAHHFAHVNTVRSAPRAPGEGFIARLDEPYMPLGMAKWERRARYGASEELAKLGKEALDSPAMSVYRWFADLPAVDGVTRGSTCVWFVDLRFLTPGRPTMPFRYGACRDEPGQPWRFATS